MFCKYELDDYDNQYNPFFSFHLFLILSYLLILITELINTAIEAIWKIAHPEFHETVGFSKDAASAAVFLAICFSVATALIIIASRLNWLL